MLLVLKKGLRGHRVPLLLMGLGLAGLGILMPATYQSLGSDMSEVLQEMPRGFQALLKTQGDAIPFLGAEGYMAVGYRHPLYLIVIIAFTITASTAVAREIEKGTIFMLLARPLPRYHLMLAKGAGLLVGLVLLLAAAVAGTAVGTAITGLDESVRLGRFLLVSVNALLLFLAIGGFGFLFSALAREGSRAISMTIGLTVTLFFVDFVAELWEPVAFLGPLSLFHYYSPVTVVQDGAVPWNHALALVAVATASFGTAVALFQRRDIP